MLSISCPRRLHEQALRSYLRALKDEGAEAVASMATRRRSMPDLAGTRGAALLQRHEVEHAMAAFKQQARSSPSLCEMGANPLLLALLIGVFLRGRQQLPELRTQLYEKGVQLLLRRVEVGETGKRDPKALAAVLKDKPQRTQRRQRRRQQQAAPTVDKAKDPAVLMEVLCRMGYMLHVEKLTRDFAAGEVFALLEDEGTDLGELSVDDACAAWEELIMDGRGILMCVERNPGTLYYTLL